MLILLSPAKSLDFHSPNRTARTSQPRFLDASEKLVRHMRGKDADELKRLMGVSGDIAELNAERFETWTGRTTRRNGRQAILAFMGDVYRAFDAQSLDGHSLAYAQRSLRILSGLYGLLRPLDLIEPYRLEMGLSLPSLDTGNLYKFWGSRITDALQDEIGAKKGQIVVNLASDEYANAVDFSKLNARVVHPKFREWRRGAYRVVSFNAKRARGHMARFLIDGRVNSYRGLLQFDRDNYVLNESLSMRDRPMFTRQSS